MFCVMIFFVLLLCVVAFSFMPPTQYSILFGGLLYRRYKSHMLFYYVLYYATLFCPVLSCADGYTACKTVLHWSVVISYAHKPVKRNTVLLCSAMCCFILHYCVLPFLQAYQRRKFAVTALKNPWKCSWVSCDILFCAIVHCAFVYFLFS